MEFLMRSIAVLNQKGGVGKTTTAVNLSSALAASGWRVCLVDLDAQAHATLHLGQTPGAEGVTIYDVLLGDAPFAAAVRPVADNLWVAGSSIDLAAAEVELAGVAGRELILRTKMAELVSDQINAGRPKSGNQPGEFDFLLIDCPPSLGVLSLNALTAVGEVLLPLQPHFLALHGLSKLLQTIDVVSRQLNPRLKLAGVVLCQYELGTRLAAEVAQNVVDFLDAEREKHTPWSGARVFQSRIRRNIRLAEAPSFGQSIFQYAPASHGAEDYRSLAEEFVNVGNQAHLAKSA
jgi:chromosome partitioning protein